MRITLLNTNEFTVIRAALFVLLFCFFTGTFGKNAVAQISVTVNNSADSTIYFQEFLEDTDFNSRGWYDNTSLQLSNTEHIPGSSGSVEFHFNLGGSAPTSGSAIRHKFTDTDEIYVSYWIKYSSNRS